MRYCLGSVQVAGGRVQHEVVGLGALLVLRRRLQELHVVPRVVLAVNQLVDFLLATQNVGVALEQALPHVVEDRQAQRLDLGPKLTPHLRLLGVAHLQILGLGVALGGLLAGDGAGPEAALVGEDGILALVPAKEGVDESLGYYGAVLRWI